MKPEQHDMVTEKGHLYFMIISAVIILGVATQVRSCHVESQRAKHGCLEAK